MGLPLLPAPRAILITPEPLSPSSFSPFGTCITSPLTPSTSSSIDRIPPLSPPAPRRYPNHQPSYTVANQSTALKFSPISPLRNAYGSAPSGRGEPLMSMFVCYPRRNVPDGRFDVRILERHPFTTQTFLPLGVGPDRSYLVVVAPSLPASSTTGAATGSGDEAVVVQGPDLTRVRAFVARGDQAVTYGVGTWHAPMVVVGRRRVEFVVVQHVSGVGPEDCEEVAVGEGIAVEVGGLMDGEAKM